MIIKVSGVRSLKRAAPLALLVALVSVEFGWCQTEVVPTNAEVNFKEPEVPDVDEELPPLPESATFDETALEIRPLMFQGIEAGLTTVAGLKQQWGPPARSDTSNGLLIYQIEPFKKVEIAVDVGKVMSIVIHLRRSANCDHIAEQLDLSDFISVAVVDQQGVHLGRVYPERGVLFNFVAGAQVPTVGQIVLEPIQAEAFLLRCKYDNRHALTRSLSDLEIATRLDPQSAEAHWLHAQVLLEAGMHLDALAAAQRAVAIEPQTIAYQLTEARILFETGERGDALTKTKMAIETLGVELEVLARGQCQMGDILARGPAADFEQALKFHQQAIATAAQLTGDQRFAVRRSAKLVLVDAHLGIARDIAMGNWRRKPEVVPKWLDRAEALVNDLATNEFAATILPLSVHTRSIGILAELGGELDTRVPTQALINEAKRLDPQAVDPLFRDLLDWNFGSALVDVASVEYARGNYDNSEQFAKNAVTILERIKGQRQGGLREQLVYGELYFLLGSLQANHHADHFAAVSWHAQAAPILRDGAEIVSLVEKSRIGNSFVSMGAVRWQMGEHEPAIDLTEQGVKHIEEAVLAEAAPREKLAIPLTNLATMHRELGNDEQSRVYSEMAARFASTPRDSSQQ